jgi:hypothetical protein
VVAGQEHLAGQDPLDAGPGAHFVNPQFRPKSFPDNFMYKKIFLKHLFFSNTNNGNA